MAILVDTLRQGAGDFVDALGSTFAPFARDTGFSEFIAGGPTLNTQAQASQDAQPAINQSFATPTETGGIFDPQGTQIGSSETRQVSSPTQSTGGTGDTRFQQLQKTTRNPVQEDEFQRLLSQLESQKGPTQSEIDAQFNPIFDVFNQAESNLRGQQPGLISEAQQQADVSTGLIQGQRTGAEELLGQQTTQTEQQQQRQVADQRRILQELGQANQARFGGASSAGQAASELQGREFQRSRFGIQQNAQQALQTIGNERNKVEREFQQGLQQIELNKQQAINDVNRRFQDKLLEIDSRRGETQAAKAQARLGALQELRNQAFQINVARLQFENDLKTQVSADTNQLSQLEQQFLGFTGAGQQAVSQFGQTTPSGIPGVQPGGRQQQQQFTGSIRDEDLIGSIAGSSETDPRFQNFQPGFSR